MLASMSLHNPPVTNLTCRHSSRMSSAEAKERERLAMEDPMVTYNNIRRAGEVHRQVRHYARRNIKPGMSMTEIANLIEDGTRALVEEDGLESGIGFPTGLSVNEVAAHYTPNAGDTKSMFGSSSRLTTMKDSPDIQSSKVEMSSKSISVSMSRGQLSIRLSQ